MSIKNTQKSQNSTKPTPITATFMQQTRYNVAWTILMLYALY